MQNTRLYRTNHRYFNLANWSPNLFLIWVYHYIFILSNTTWRIANTILRIKFAINIWIRSKNDAIWFSQAFKSTLFWVNLSFVNDKVSNITTLTRFCLNIRWTFLDVCSNLKRIFSGLKVINYIYSHLIIYIYNDRI